LLETALRELPGYVLSIAVRSYSPVYHSRYSVGAPSGRINVAGEVDEALELITTDRGASDETFVDVSYVLK